MKAVIIAGLFLYPTLLLAQDTGLIPCSGVDCQACHLVELGQNILKWLITIMISVIGVIFAIAGMLLVTSGANEGNITKAKSMMTNAIIGLIILLAAWLIVDTILKIFVNEAKVGPWNSVQCVAQPEYNTNPSGGPGGVGTTTPGGGVGSCTVPTSGYCSETYLQAEFGAQAKNAAMICNAESAGDPGSESRVDKLSTGDSFSFGLFQINLTVHVLQGCGQTLNCYQAFEGKNKNAKIINRALFDQCIRAAKNPSCNIKNAGRIYRTGSGWRQWGAAPGCNL